MLYEKSLIQIGFGRQSNPAGRPPGTAKSFFLHVKGLADCPVGSTCQELSMVQILPFLIPNESAGSNNRSSFNSSDQTVSEPAPPDRAEIYAWNDSYTFL
jgi:hypothetical protein